MVSAGTVRQASTRPSWLAGCVSREHKCEGPDISQQEKPCNRRLPYYITFLLPDA
jgi:hypothetical protein